MRIIKALLAHKEINLIIKDDLLNKTAFSWHLLGISNDDLTRCKQSIASSVSNYNSNYLDSITSQGTLLPQPEIPSEETDIVDDHYSFDYDACCDVVKSFYNTRNE